MVKKKLNIILIIIVILLWIVIIYRIIGYTRNPGNSNSGLINPEKAEKNESKEDTVFIFNNYRDPFLGASIKQEAVLQPQVLKPIPRPELNKAEWPMISYTGLVSKPETKTTLALLSINNKPEILATGDVYGTLRIIAVYPDSVKVSLHNEIKTFIKP